MSERSYGRGPGELRPAAIEPNFMRTATGSALISLGETRVICTASAQESVPRWLAGRGRGWVTAEYGMLPASTGERKQRDATRGRLDGRTVEIQRLIGRSLRGIVDFEALGERTIYLDCDVLQADGGTRCASITGAHVALSLACSRLRTEGLLESSPLAGSVAAVSCGMIDGTALLDLDYAEDSTAEVDANVVMTGDGGLVEVQATAERTPLSRAHLDELLALAASGIEQLRGAQEQAIAQGATPSACADDRSRVAARDPQRAQAPRVRATARARRVRRVVARDAPRRPRAAAGGWGRRSPRTRSGRRAPPREMCARASIADDSGIAAAALGGLPGVRSARYAGEHASDRENLEKLMREAPAGSALEYVCAIAYVDPAEPVERVFEGRCGGRMATRAARRARLRL